MDYLVMPSTVGWIVMWYTGEIKQYKERRSDGTVLVKEVRKRDSFRTTSKERAERKAEELKRSGLEVICLSECIY